MKKISIVLLIVVCFLTMGCGKEVKENDNKDSNPEVYTFSYNGLDYVLGSEFTTSKYGKEDSYSEAASCAFDGADKTFTYEHFEVATYPDGDIDRIASVYFLDHEIKTPEGISLGDSINDMTNTYGSDYQQSENLYTYTLGRTHLNFIVENDIITSIEYYYDTEN